MPVPGLTTHRGNRASRRSPGGSSRFASCGPVARARVSASSTSGCPPSSAVRKLEPQPQPLTAFGLLTVKPAPIRVST